MQRTKIAMENRIFKHGKHWELISGPWKVYEAWLMSKHIDSFKPHIDCITEEVQGDIFVYRCAMGYINERAASKKANRTVKPRYRPVLSEFRKIQREIQQSMMTKKEWLNK